MGDSNIVLRFVNPIIRSKESFRPLAIKYNVRTIYKKSKYVKLQVRYVKLEAKSIDLTG